MRTLMLNDTPINRASDEPVLKRAEEMVDSKIAVVNESLNGLNIRYNSTTDYLEIYANGQWNNYKKLGYQRTYLYNNGTQSVGWDTGNYTYSGSYSHKYWTLGASNANVTVGANNNTMYPLGTSNKFDFSGYSKLGVKGTFNGSAFDTYLDISNVAEAYLIFNASKLSSSANLELLYMLSAQKTNFNSSRIKYGQTITPVASPSNYNVIITEVWVE